METRRSSSGSRIAPLLEFGLIGAACALAYFWIIPAQISSAPGIGLSPDLPPKICVIAMAIIATVNALMRPRVEVAPSKAPPPRYVAGLLVAVGAGVAAITYAGLVAGGTVLVVVVTVALGERRPVRLLLHALGAAAIMSLIPTLRL